MVSACCAECGHPVTFHGMELCGACRATGCGCAAYSGPSPSSNRTMSATEVAEETGATARWVRDRAADLGGFVVSEKIVKGKPVKIRDSMRFPKSAIPKVRKAMKA